MVNVQELADQCKRLAWSNAGYLPLRDAIDRLVESLPTKATTPLTDEQFERLWALAFRPFRPPLRGPYEELAWGCFMAYVNHFHERGIVPQDGDRGEGEGA